MATNDDPGLRYAEEILTQLTEDNRVGGVRYINTILTTTDPNYTDTMPAGVRLRPALSAFYWPGGDNTGHRFQTVGVGEVADLREADLEIRRATANSRVGELAIEGLKLFEDHWAAFENRTGGKSLLSLERMCAYLRLPLAVCLSTRAVKDDTVLPGQQMLHFWSPLAISPVRALFQLQVEASGLRRSSLN